MFDRLDLNETKLTPREKAAIELRVEMSGSPALDAMIRESRRLDMATAAMRDTTTPEWCLLKAAALLAASGKESGSEQTSDSI